MLLLTDLDKHDQECHLALLMQLQSMLGPLLGPVPYILISVYIQTLHANITYTCIN